MPGDPSERAERCAEVYAIQRSGLRTRLRGSGLDRIVIGVSGGIDSTQALLVAVACMDDLSLPRSNVLAYTMPGFATSTRTLGNAHRLMEALGVSAEEIDIKPAAMQMLHDLVRTHLGLEAMLKQSLRLWCAFQAPGLNVAVLRAGRQRAAVGREGRRENGPRAGYRRRHVHRRQRRIAQIDDAHRDALAGISAERVSQSAAIARQGERPRRNDGPDRGAARYLLLAEILRCERLARDQAQPARRRLGSGPRLARAKLARVRPATADEADACRRPILIWCRMHLAARRQVAQI